MTRFTAPNDLSALDAQVAWHYTQIATLKAKRNSMVPILRLPNEILSRIFTFYTRDSDSLFDTKWTQISLVCRRWHGLALAERALLLVLNVNKRRWNAALAQIKHSAAPRLAIKVSAFPSAYYPSFIFNESKRIHALEYFSFPILASLSLSSHDNRNFSPGGFSSLPDVLFDGHLPSLRALSLSGIPLPWNRVSNLKALALTNCSNSATSVPSKFDDLLAMIRACPRLCTLRLEGDRDTALPEPSPDGCHSAVDLPLLNDLKIRSTVNFCTVLLESLHFPPTAALTILPYDANISTHFQDILVPITKHMRAAVPTVSLLKIDSACTGMIINERVHLTMSFSTDSTPGPLFGRNDFSVSLSADPHSTIAQHPILLQIIKAAPCASISHMDARSATALWEVSWRATLQLLPALQTVYVAVHYGGVKLLRAFCDISSMYPEERADFPRIRRLHVSFSYPSEDTTELDNFLLELEVYVTLSSEQGTLLDELDLHDPEQVLEMHQWRLERLFHIIDGAGTIMRDGTAYKPV
ncbi:hypothetical protein GGX14DRAFT_572470 [Mycena pura]|uniref:F-box domain-containing protein n=1 Tax=Mycena pura TaxID=153505 RepID=A0AAD6V172_9AGAR|nr:hypothetical protein GGX14DRAFT_572470 [Mycena pura]